LNKELLRMQMLAGIITESQYKAMLNEEMFGWDEGDLTEEELKKVKLLMSLKPYEDKINKLNTDEELPGTNYHFSQIDFDDQRIDFVESTIDPEYGWEDDEVLLYDFFDVDDKLLKPFLEWLNLKGIETTP
jgi:hypothetical protein